MTVYRLKHRRNAWAYEFVREGKRYRGRCLDLQGKPVKSHGEAVDAEIREKFCVQGGVRPERAKVYAGTFTIGNAAKEHLQRCTDRSCKPAHLRHQNVYVREILDYFGSDTPFSEIGQERVDAYVAFCSQQVVKRWTIPPGNSGRAASQDPKDLPLVERRRSAGYINHYLNCLRALIAVAAEARDADGKPALKGPIQINLFVNADLKVTRL